MASSRSSKSPNPGKMSGKPHSGDEQGDHIINWNLSYSCSLLNSASSQLDSFLDQMRAEIIKTETDSKFISENLPGPHHHLAELTKTRQDLRLLLAPFEKLTGQTKNTAQRIGKRAPV